MAWPGLPWPGPASHIVSDFLLYTRAPALCNRGPVWVGGGGGEQGIRFLTKNHGAVIFAEK